MNIRINTKDLAAWIRSLIESAKADETFSISWFNGTKDSKFSIVGGWMEGFSEDYNDILCISKSNPNYAMCVKIAVNNGPYNYTDFEIMDMPVDSNGEVDNTCIALDLDEDVDAMADFFSCEWERITREFEENR